MRVPCSKQAVGEPSALVWTVVVAALGAFAVASCGGPQGPSSPPPARVDVPDAGATSQAPPPQGGGADAGASPAADAGDGATAGGTGTGDTPSGAGSGGDGAGQGGASDAGATAGGADAGGATVGGGAADAGVAQGGGSPDAGPPDAGAAPPPPSGGGAAQWLVTQQFGVRAVAADGAGGAFLTTAHVVPFGSTVVGSDLARVDGAGHVLWTRSFGPVAGCGVIVDFALAPLPGGHVAVPFIAQDCSESAPVPELGGQTLETSPILELDGDGRFVRRLADRTLVALRATSDGGLVGLSAVGGQRQKLVKLGRDGVEQWQATVGDPPLAAVDVAADDAGGAVVAVVESDAQTGAPLSTRVQRFGSTGRIWSRDLPPRVLAQSVAVLAGGTVVAEGGVVGPADFTWGAKHVQVPAGGARELLFTLSADGAARDAVEVEATNVAALADGSALAYNAEDCHIARYSAALDLIWARQLASLPGAPSTAPCRQTVAFGGRGVAAASPSLLVVVGKEDGPGDFGNGLVSASGQGGFAVGLAP